MYEVSHKQKSMFFATLSFVFVTGGALILPTTKQLVGVWIGIVCEALGTICALASVIEYKKGVNKKK